MNIREENPTDYDAVHVVHRNAFEREAEGNLVDVLRNKVESYVSLVAEIDSKIVGHILFTPVSLTGSPKLKLIGLAPLAVLPEYQFCGVGSNLVQEGISRCKLIGCSAIVVFGHPHYYPKFGFVSSVKYGIKSEYGVSDDKFMILELVDSSLKDNVGTIKYHKAFESV